jgi:hypothetical protein
VISEFFKGKWYDGHCGLQQFLLFLRTAVQAGSADAAGGGVEQQ